MAEEHGQGLWARPRRKMGRYCQDMEENPLQSDGPWRLQYWVLEDSKSSSSGVCQDERYSHWEYYLLWLCSTNQRLHLQVRNIQKQPTIRRQLEVMKDLKKEEIEEMCNNMDHSDFWMQESVDEAVELYVHKVQVWLNHLAPVKKIRIRSNNAPGTSGPS